MAKLNALVLVAAALGTFPIGRSSNAQSSSLRWDEGRNRVAVAICHYRDGNQPPDHPSNRQSVEVDLLSAEQIIEDSLVVRLRQAVELEHARTSRAFFRIVRHLGSNADRFEITEQIRSLLERANASLLDQAYLPGKIVASASKEQQRAVCRILFREEIDRLSTTNKDDKAALSELLDSQIEEERVATFKQVLLRCGTASSSSPKNKKLVARAVLEYQLQEYDRDVLAQALPIDSR